MKLISLHVQSFTILESAFEWLFDRGKVYFVVYGFLFILNFLRSFRPKVNVGNETNLVQVRFRVVTDGNLF